MDYYSLLKEIYENGKEYEIRGLKTKELLGVRLTVTDYNFFSFVLSRDIDLVKKYFFGELAWYLSGSTDVKDIMKYSKFWDKIKNPDETVNSNYGYLIFHKENKNRLTSFEWVVRSLIKDKYSRQAIALYNDRDYYYDYNKDFVCSQLQHFFIRDNKLISFVYLRSSDAILGLTYDIPWWSFVHQQVLLRLKDVYPELILGEMEVTIGSCHIYENKYSLVEQMLYHDNMQKYFVKLNVQAPLRQKMSWYEEHIACYFSINSL
jgi:thymidylate synthase